MPTEIQWLGQAGFRIRTAAGTTVTIDPYLSDSCNALVGFKRMIPPPEAMEDFHTDHLLISHEHPDHLDLELYPTLKENIRIYGNVHCKQTLEENGLDASRLQLIAIGDTLQLDDVKVEVLAADHGEMCPDALGFLITADGHTIYFAGDTAYSPALLQRALDARPEVALLPINGAFGNLDSKEAARLADQLGAKVLIPCHYWMFVEHMSYPYELLEASKNMSARVQFLAVGETTII